MAFFMRNAARWIGLEQSVYDYPRSANAPEEEALTLFGHIRYVCTNTRFCVTTTGKLCLRPLEAKEGDEVTVLFGASMPIVLRPVETWKTWVGPVFVDGIMDGELVERNPSQGIVPLNFVIR